MSLSSLIALTSICVAGCAVAAFTLLAMVHRRHLLRERNHYKKNQADIADLSILFQTMRDVILQQKNLAKDFNKELDVKMAMVKQVLARGMEKNESLYERQQRLSAQLEEAHAQLRSLQRQIAFLKESVAASGAQLATGARAAGERSPAVEEYQKDAADAFEEIRDTPVFKSERLIPVEGSAAESDRASDAEEEEAWLALPEIVAEEAEEEPAPPIYPEDRATAQQAFRDLLDLAPQEASPPPPPPSEALGRALQPPKRHSGNGRDAETLRKRVREYHQAGMSVTEISKELGIGKGEVRLMISLMQGKTI